MKVTEYDGNSFSSDYTVTILGGGGISLPQVAALASGRTGGWPYLSGIARPGRSLVLGVTVEGANLDNLRKQLFQWFDPEDEVPKKLTITDDDGSSNERYLETLCQGIFPMSSGGRVVPRIYVVSLAVHREVRWLAETASTDSWNITATGQTKALSNTGEDDAYLSMKIKPTSAKTGGFTYKRWIPIRWRSSYPASNYPVDLTGGGYNTAALVTGSKAQSDGDDFRVEVDGSEVDRWFGSGSYAFNQTTTKIWANLDFEANVEMTLKTAIAGSGDVSEIEVNESIVGISDAGAVVIGSEAFVYTSKNNASKTLLGVTRAAKGTSMASHSVDTDVFWIQRDVWWKYGNTGASAPTQDDDYQPAFNLSTSTNSSWDYDDFGAGSPGVSKRSGSWVMSDTLLCYTGDRGATADPWSEIGVHGDPDSIAGQARFYLYSPCGLTNANFQNGEKWAELSLEYAASIESSSDGYWWATEYAVPSPSSSSTWESWSRNEALSSGAMYVGLFCAKGNSNTDNYVEAADVTISLGAGYPWQQFVGTEQTTTYSLDCLITNNTTGDAIELEYTMLIDEELQVDTYNKEVTYLEDNSKQLQALSLVGGARRHWLPLQPGSNTLQYDETGVGTVTIAFEWRRRFYD